MKDLYIYIVLSLFVLFGACSKDHEPAIQHLSNARTFLESKDFVKAKAQLDSINVLYPKSFAQRKEAMVLLDSIRYAQNLWDIMYADSLLQEHMPALEKMKTDFVYTIDKKYQESGSFIPKEIIGNSVLSYTTLQSGVEEDGRIYLESVYIGGQKHNKLNVTADKGGSAESLVVAGDGYIHRFTDLGKSYEVIRFIGANENNVAKFVAENSNATLKANLTGADNTTYTLPAKVKMAIVKSYNLSVQMQLIDSLKTMKEKAEFKNFYLDNGKQTAVPVEGGE